VPGRDDQEAVRYRINRLRLEGETRVGGNKLSARLGMLDGHKDSDIVRRGSGGPERESYRHQEREVNGALRLDRAWAARLFSLGLEFSWLRRQKAQDYSGSDAVQASYLARERQTSLWLQDEWGASPALTLTSGLRAEWIGLESDGEARSHQGLYPSLAARWELQEGWQLRLAAGGAIKAPRLDEISGAPVRSSSANSPLEPDQRVVSVKLCKYASWVKVDTGCAVGAVGVARSGAHSARLLQAASRNTSFFCSESSIMFK